MTIFDIIHSYKIGVPFEKLRIEDIICNLYEFPRYASEYGVKCEDFDTTEEEVNNYIFELDEVKYDYFEKRKYLYEDLWFILFTLIIIGTFGVQLLFINNEYGFIISILSIAISYKFLFPLFKDCCKKLIIDRFFSKKGIIRNKNVEDYFNEVMFQAYIRNRNPKLERNNH